MARLGRTLANQGRSADARKWFDQAVKLAPIRRELRLALIEQLTQERQIRRGRRTVRGPGQARAEQPRRRPRLGPDAPPRHQPARARPQEGRRAGLAPARPRRRQGCRRRRPGRRPLPPGRDLNDEAIALYLEKAIKLAPESSQYREYLGEYYHALKRPGDALATWRATRHGDEPIEPPRALGRLGEVLAGFGYRKEALEPLTEACKLEPEPTSTSGSAWPTSRLALEQPLDALPELEKAAKARRRRRAGRGGPRAADPGVPGLGHAREPAGSRQCSRADMAKAGRPPPAGPDWLASWRPTRSRPRPPRRSARRRRSTPNPSPPGSPPPGSARRPATSLGSAEALRTLTTLDRRIEDRLPHRDRQARSRLGRRGPALEAGRELLAAAPGTRTTTSSSPSSASSSASPTRASTPSAGPRGPTRPTPRRC